MRTFVVAALLVVLTGCTTEPPRAEPPTATPVTSDPPSQTPEAEPPWDPRDVDDLPHAATDVARGLPAAVDPPAKMPLLEAEPMSAAVLSVKRRGGRIQLLGVDGSWREIQAPERYPREALSPDGTRLLMLLSDGLELWDLPTGERTTMPLPAGFRPWDYAWVGWIDESSVLLDDYRGGWRVNVESGATERTPYPRWNSAAWTIDDQGDVIEVADPSRTPAILDWTGGTPDRTELVSIGHLQAVRVRGDTVIGTTYDDRGFAAVSLDRSDPAAVERLPLGDFEGNYSNWALRSAAVLPDGSALLWVAIPGPDRKDGWRLVRWIPGTDRLEIVTTSESDPTWPLTFARELLAPRPGWNPRNVDDLPAAADDVAPLLPAVLKAPASSPALAERPIEAAVLTLGGDDAVHLLSVDGTWRSVPWPTQSGSVVLTRDGTRLAVQTDTGVDVWDLPTGKRTSLRVPPRHRGSDATWAWLDRDTLLLDDLGPGWRVDARTGDARRLPYPGGPWTVDDGGAVVETNWGNLLTDWASGKPRRVRMSATGRLEMFQATGDTIAGTSAHKGGLAVYVVNRSDLAPRHVLRVRDDRQTIYANGGLSVQGILDDGTVLVRVLLYEQRKASVRFVAWDPATDELSLVTRTLDVLPAWSVASDLLG